MDSELTAYYNRDYWGPGDEPEWFDPNSPPSDWARRLLTREVKPDDQLLDMGCGLGSDYGVWLSGWCRGYHGVDISERAVERAASYGMRNVQTGSVTDLPYEGGRFDVAICLEVLEHLFDPEPAVREALRVLRPGGRLIATAPNVAHWANRLRLLAGVWVPGGVPDERTWRDPHIRFFTGRSLRALIAGAGFEHVTVAGYTDQTVRGAIRRRRGLPGNPGPVALALSRRKPAFWASRLIVIATRG